MSESERHAEDERRWAAWMAHAQDGAGADYARLLDELGRAIETYIRVRFGTIEALEDCVQECLIAVHQARHTYNPKRAFRPWLFTIVRHKTIDTLRRRQSWISARQTLANAAGDGADTSMETALKLIDGIRLLETLSPDHREVVVMTKYAGMTTAETASWLGISESAVKARLNRALKAMLKYLEREVRAYA